MPRAARRCAVLVALTGRLAAAALAFAAAALALPSAAALALAAAALTRHFAAGLSRFAQADRNRLFAARHLLAGTAGLERAPLALVHRPLDLALCLLAV